MNETLGNRLHGRPLGRSARVHSLTWFTVTCVSVFLVGSVSALADPAGADAVLGLQRMTLQYLHQRLDAITILTTLFESSGDLPALRAVSAAVLADQASKAAVGCSGDLTSAQIAFRASNVGIAGTSTPSIAFEWSSRAIGQSTTPGSGSAQTHLLQLGQYSCDTSATSAAAACWRWETVDCSPALRAAGSCRLVEHVHAGDSHRGRAMSEQHDSAAPYSTAPLAWLEPGADSPDYPVVKLAKYSANGFCWAEVPAAQLSDAGLTIQGSDVPSGVVVALFARTTGALVYSTRPSLDGHLRDLRAALSSASWRTLTDSGVMATHGLLNAEPARIFTAPVSIHSLQLVLLLVAQADPTATAASVPADPSRCTLSNHELLSAVPSSDLMWSAGAPITYFTLISITVLITLLVASAVLVLILRPSLTKAARLAASKRSTQSHSPLPQAIRCLTDITAALTQYGDVLNAPDVNSTGADMRVGAFNALSALVRQYATADSPSSRGGVNASSHITAQAGKPAVTAQQSSGAMTNASSSSLAESKHSSSPSSPDASKLPRIDGASLQLAATPSWLDHLAYWLIGSSAPDSTRAGAGDSVGVPGDSPTAAPEATAAAEDKRATAAIRHMLKSLVLCLEQAMRAEDARKRFMRYIFHEVRDQSRQSSVLPCLTYCCDRSL